LRIAIPKIYNKKGAGRSRRPFNSARAELRSFNFLIRNS
jgi:hypothetical protein